jgi:hypothetical protein
MKCFSFFKLPNLPSALGPEVYSASKEMSIRSREIVFLRSREQSVCRDDDFATICEQNV